MACFDKLAFKMQALTTNYKYINQTEDSIVVLAI